MTHSYQIEREDYEEATVWALFEVSDHGKEFLTYAASEAEAEGWRDYMLGDAARRPTDPTMSDHEWDMYLRGCECPRMMALEAEDQWREDMVTEQDAMEARGGPVFRMPYADDEIPF